MDIENIRGALARGYCEEGQTEKVMDPDLCEAQAQEIMKLFPQSVETTPDDERDPYSDFESELSGLLNRYSIDNRTATPDFMLAQYVTENLRLLEEKHRAYMHWSQPQELKPTTHPS